MSKPNLTKIELNELEIKILTVLQRGHKNAIGLADLGLRLNLTSDNDKRKARLGIETLRLQGYMILFAQKEIIYVPDHTGKLVKTVLPSGYFLAETLQEVHQFLDYMKSRIIAECKIRQAIKIAAVKHFGHQFGQLPLFFN